jgi:hypothetical protein
MNKNIFLILLGLIFLVGVAGFVIVLLTGGDTGDIDLNSLAAVIIIATVIISLGMVIISNINSC